MEFCQAQTFDFIIKQLSPIQIFTQLLKTLLLALCTFSTENLYPPDRSSEILNRDLKFDFIIVGGGTAGSVLASRLSERKDWRILLIEEGEDPSLESRIPTLMYSLLHGKEDYSYETEPNDNYCLGMENKRCIWSKGRALGGSSILNAMLHVHGNAKDYDQWVDMGNDGWSYEEVLAYFRKSESFDPELAARLGEKYVGTDGPLPIHKFEYSKSAYPDILLETVNEMGIPILESFNGKDKIGYGRADGTLNNGLRVNAAEAFLGKVEDRKNLYILKSTKAERILLSGQQATGVRLRLLKDNKIINVSAEKEVILAAGSVATPQILMLSGIGPHDQLEEFQLPIVVDLPVGKNLQDHILSLGVYLTVPVKNQPKFDPGTTLDSVYEFLIHQKGILTTTGGSDILGFVNVDDPSSQYPNVQFHHSHLPKDHFSLLDLFKRTSRLTNEIIDQLMRLLEYQDIIMIAPTLLNPKSVGEMRLRSRDPRDPPKIIQNYFGNSDDMRIMIKSIEVIRNMTRTRTMQEAGVKLHLLNIPGCEYLKPDSDEYWECNFRHTGNTVYHAVGTCKMGPREDLGTVVDSRLRVHGVERLRVIDASIMPKITSGNTNSPTLMIAEKGADMIKNDWFIRDEL